MAEKTVPFIFIQVLLTHMDLELTLAVGTFEQHFWKTTEVFYGLQKKNCAHVFVNIPTEGWKVSKLSN